MLPFFKRHFCVTEGKRKAYMSSLEFYTSLSAIWIAIAWFPYILDRIMVHGLTGTMANPTPSLAWQSGWAMRAKAAHGVVIQAFAAYPPLAITVSRLNLVLRPENNIGCRKSSVGYCQTKLTWDGVSGFVASPYDKTRSIQVLQNEPKDHPPGCDALCSVFYRFSSLNPN